MTIASTGTVERYMGDGVQTLWPVGFPFFRPEHVRAGLGGESGDMSLLAYGQDYTVTRDEGARGGAVRCVVPEGVRLTLWLDQPFTQDMDLRNTGMLDAEALEQACDRLTLMAQQLREELGRCVKVGVGETTMPDTLLARLDASVALAADGAVRAETATTASETARAGADVARTGAESARAGAEAAKAGAETARDAAGAKKGEVTLLVEQAKTELMGIAAGVPIGMEATFPINSIPSGWLVEMGQTVTRAAYPDLVTYLTGGTVAETATLPDMRGEFARGADIGRGVDAGRTPGSWQGDAIRNITGEAGYSEIGGLTQANGVTSGAFKLGSSAANRPIGDGYAGYRLAFDASRVVPTASENRPRNVAKVWCIKAYHAPSNTAPTDITAVMERLDAQAAAVNPNVGRWCTVSAGTTAAQTLTANVVTVVSNGGSQVTEGRAWAAAGDGSLSIVIPEDGDYDLSAQVAVWSGAQGGHVWAYITVNGANVHRSLCYRQTVAPDMIQPRCMRSCAAGDVVRVAVTATQTTSCSGTYNKVLTARRIR